jgi:DUF971 family protein
LSKAKDSLFVKFDNGYETTLSAELLRVESPSAEVQGHGAGKKPRLLAKPMLPFQHLNQLAIMPFGSALAMAMIPGF